MFKNVAGQVIGAQMVSATDGSAFTGAVTVYVTGDGGTQAVGSVGSGTCAHEGNGFHTYAPAQAETNYSHIGFTFIGTGAVPVTVQVYTGVALGNVAQGGAAAVLTLERVVVASTTSNQPALKLTGNGSGSGLEAAGGAANGSGIYGQGTGTGAGLSAVGGATGPGAYISGGSTSGIGIQARGAGANPGIVATGGATGNGLECTGGASGHGLVATGVGTSRHGIIATGAALGTSHGISAVGGNINGHGLNAAANGATANGINAASTSNNGINVNGGTGGVVVSVNSGNNPAIEAIGVGSGAGMQLTGGATGHGLQCSGGATSGDGVSYAGTGSGAGARSAPDAVGFGAGGGSGATAAEVWAYADRQLTASPGPTAAQVATQVRTELAVELARLDAAVTTRLAAADYTAPPGAAPTAPEVADALLGRNLAGGADGGRTVRDALRAMRNKVAIDPDTDALTVYAENDTDVAWAGVVTTAAGAEPIRSIDPA